MKKQSNSLGSLHGDSVKRNNTIPPAAKGFPPTAVPGNKGTPIIHDKDTGTWKEKPR